MKKVFEYIGLMSLVCFSFFITEKTTLVVQEVDEIMVKIKDNMHNYTVKSVDAKIDKDTIVPGLVGKSVNVGKSYQNMKEKGLYDQTFYIYDSLVPAISLDDNFDKYITSGNFEKRMVSLVFIVENKNISDIQNIVGNTPVSFVIENSNVDRELDNILSTVNLKNEILISTDTDESYNLLTKKLNSLNININYCYNESKDVQFLRNCQNDQRYSIYTSKIITKEPLREVKRSLSSGSILVFKITDELKNELPNIISYINSRGYTINVISEHLTENW